MRGPFRALGHVTAWQPLFDVGLGVHRELVSPAVSCLVALENADLQEKTQFSIAFAGAVAISL
jgi:hypothetical protein